MTKCKVIALVNQKGGTAKTTTTLNLGIGLAHQGRKVLLVDADPQGDLTTALGWTDADNLPITFAYSARTAHPFQRNGAPFRFKLRKAQQVD